MSAAGAETGEVRKPQAAGGAGDQRSKINRMKIGLFSMTTGPCTEPEALREVGRLAEELGYDSLWGGEHVVIPDPQTPDSRMEPRERITDPLIALAVLAGCTRRVRLGTGVIILPERHPVVLAKQVASLDVLSGGRLILGIGVGYVQRELSATGAAMSERGTRTDEYLAAMESLWYAEHPSYQGRHVAFSEVDAHPRPVQSPLPLVIGGYAPAALERAARKAQGWYGFALDPEQTAHHVAELRRAEQSAGRPPGMGPLEVSVTPRGTVDAARLREFAEAGVDRLVLSPPRRSQLPELLEWVREHRPAAVSDRP